jgi:hypothetical protein
MKYTLIVSAIGLWIISVGAAFGAEEGGTSLERRFRELPMEAKQLTGPLFWVHGDESKERLETYIEKIAEGGNGTFTVESRPHSDWLGEGWFRDLQICLNAAKKNNLSMWIFDEKWWPSQSVAGKVPPQYAAKRLEVSAMDFEGPRKAGVEGCEGPRFVAALAGRLNADGKIEGDTLVDLASHISNGMLAWDVPEGKWKIMKFTHVQAPALAQNGQLSVDGASKDCVDWFIETVYQPHYDHFKADFGKTILGFFYDEPETCGDWGTELKPILDERKVDWKKAYAAYKFELAGEEQAAAKYQYLEAFAEAWGRTMYGGVTRWCHEHGVKSIGHFMEHAGLYYRTEFCAGDMMRLQGYSDMGAIDAVFSQFTPGKRVTYDAPTWQTPKLGSSISHAYGKPDDVSMVEIFGARGQNLPYSEMKWWTDHMQVSGVNFMIPHSFNPRAPYDTDCPPYFYMGEYEPRWPLYRVYANYTSRLSLMLTGGRHVCPVALLFFGQSLHVGRAVTPEDMTSAIQDAQLDCDWLPYEVFERDAGIKQKDLGLRDERYQVLVVPPVEAIPYATLKKAKDFFDAGGTVVGYGFLPSKSASLGKGSKEIAELREAIWGKDTKPSTDVCRRSDAGGKAFFLEEKPTPEQLQKVFANAGIAPSLQVLEGDTGGWLHVLHRVKEGRDVFFICNQNIQGAARKFKFRAAAAGSPESWDALRNEIAAIPFERIDEKTVEFSLSMEPNSSALVVFQPIKSDRPMLINSGVKPIGEPIAVARDANPAAAKPAADSTNPSAKDAFRDCKWVWFPEGDPTADAPVGTRYFRKTIDIPAGHKIKGTLFALTADNDFTLFVNGKPAGKSDGETDNWRVVKTADITKQLQEGRNVLAIAATNAGDKPSPAGLIGQFVIAFEDGFPLIGTIDKSWKVSIKEQAGWNGPDFDDSAWVATKELVPFGGGPWGTFDGRRNVTVSPLAAADPFRGRFTIPEDLLKAKLRFFLEMDELPDDSASVTVNGRPADGLIGKPSRLDITPHVKAGENAILIEPLTPKNVRLIIYP